MDNEIIRTMPCSIEAEQYVLGSVIFDNECLSDVISKNKYTLIDPLDVASVMDKLEKEIHEFETEVDAALLVSNALTVIEFEY